jgi:class 3 adenylate cyclase
VPSCSACAHETRPGARFCEACGAPLVHAPAAAGERRQIAVMFCDIVESTPISQRLDPEDWRDVLRDFQRMANAPVERFGGRVAQVLGDGMLSYFGDPIAHEDDVGRALHAGLEILVDLDALNARHRDVLPEPLRVRISVHSGLVVIGEVGAGHGEQLALGDAVHVASRLLSIAEPNTIVCSDVARRLAGPRFDFEDLGVKTLRGVTGSVVVCRVLRARRGAGVPVARTPLVGRDREMEQLVAHWSETRAGRGRAVLVSGEAGIGKSRLLAGLREEVRSGEGGWLEWHGSSYHGGTALHPVRTELEQALRLGPGASPEDAAERLAALLEPTGGASPETLALLAHLLSLPLPPGHPAVPQSAETRRRRTLEALCDAICRRAVSRPLVLAMEDLHWADPTTLELLGRLVLASPELRLLLVCTHRPHFAPTWSGDALHSLPLGPLTRWQSGALVDAIAAGRSFPEGVRDRLIERTDGIPLFVEELTRAVLESEDAGDEAANAVEIPSTLRSLLASRLDGLGPARQVAQVASVIGRRFSRALLEAVGPATGPALDRALERLVATGLAMPTDDPRGPGYAFRHALIQEAAYVSQLRGERRAVHERVARALTGGFPEQVEAEPEVLARHCEAAGMLKEAARYYHRAGEHALDRSAHTEALRHLERGIGLVEQLPEGPERARLELQLLVAIGSPITALKGFGHPDIERTQRRAYALSREVGEGPELYQAYGALYLFYGPRAELERGSELASGLIEMGRRRGERFIERMGEGFLGLMEFYRGHFSDAWRHCERMLALELESGPVPEWYVHDLHPEVIARYCGSSALAALGRVEEMRRMSDEMILCGRKSGQAFNHGFAVVFAGLALHTCGDVERVDRCGLEALEVCGEQGYPIILGLATALRGWALAERGEPGEGAALVQRGLAIGSEARALIEGPRVLGLLAEAQLRAGELEAARAAVDGGLGIAERCGNVFWNAELERLRAEIALREDASARPAAADDLRRALARARGQGSALLERRALETARRYRMESVVEEP